MSNENKSKTFTVRVTVEGLATITAATKAEASRRARAGDFDGVRLPRPSALISTLRES
jgi:hypothetical protein